nr:5-(carboxyamino)imidazole ribonucleotide mutase [Paenibacillus assamensis]
MSNVSQQEAVQKQQQDEQQRGFEQGVQQQHDRDQEQVQVGVIMGSTSDWNTMKKACDILEQLHIPYEARVVSAHRTPDEMFRYAELAEERGIRVIIAGAGGAAHLPGMVAAKTVVPVIGVPVKSSTLSGWDSLLSIVQMPAGVPVATVAIGEAGAANAGLLAAQILGITDKRIKEQLKQLREQKREQVVASGVLV